MGDIKMNNEKQFLINYLASLGGLKQSYNERQLIDIMKSYDYHNNIELRQFISDFIKAWEYYKDTDMEALYITAKKLLK